MIKPVAVGVTSPFFYPNELRWSIELYKQIFSFFKVVLDSLRY